MYIAGDNYTPIKLLNATIRTVLSLADDIYGSELTSCVAMAISLHGNIKKIA